MWSFADMQRRYREYDLPWDRPEPPPEVIDMARRLPPGRMLDLGCGSGRACLFLARQGWQCIGIDVIPEAIDLARERAHIAGLADAITFHVSSVTMLSFLQTPVDLALDVGCMHVLTGTSLTAYAAEVARLVRPGGTYLLFCHTRDETSPDDAFGQSEATIRTLFASRFLFEWVEHGITHVNDQTWPSAWYWMTRTTDET